ncbi:hypothetical protein BJX68DRAFT_229730 [Aspergillus pseudodeflectus]|uniref:Dolichol phosphate-mannose biosynthesis regulatory protein n=1 Tax=Aspergillus pseudodeflectus TaxID=176178 RepID=A0ABR4KXF7_9EURO
MPFDLLVRSPIVFPVAIYLATLYGCLYLLFTTVTDISKPHMAGAPESTASHISESGSASSEAKSSSH